MSPSRDPVPAYLLATLCICLWSCRAWGGPEPGQLAREIRQATAVRGGLIVHLGCGDGKLTAALRASDSYVVHGLDRDPANVARAREHARSLGLAGFVGAARWREPGLPYADNLVDLLVAAQPVAVPEAEILRVLAPRGVAYLRGEDGRWRKAVKPWPRGMDGWTHGDHGPDGNPVSQDVLVGPPRRVQWMAGPAWSKKHWGPRISALVTSGGRLFCVQDKTPTSLFNVAARWVLTAREAFNGVVLWRRELPDWTGKGWGKVVRRKGTPEAPGGLVLGLYGELGGGSGIRDGRDVVAAAGDRLYLPLGRGEPVSALDAATGEVLRAYPGISPVEEVAVAHGLLLIGGGGKVWAVEPETGQRRWAAEGGNICAATDRVCLTGPRGRSVVCLELESGRRLWELGFDRAIRQTPGPRIVGTARFTGPLQAGAGILLAMVRDRRQLEGVAVALGDGAPLWRGRFGGEPFARGSGPFVIDGAIWVLDSAHGVVKVLDPRTGKTRRELAAPAIRYVGHHARCCRARATPRYIIGKERGADFVDLQSGRVWWHNWVRGPCHRGVIPANGLLYAGQHSCRCYTEAALHGFWALAPRSGGDARPPTRSRRLERGPAYGKAGGEQGEATEHGWPTYRHDAERSGGTNAQPPTKLHKLWTAALGGRATAPAIAGRRVFVAAIDHHSVQALSADTGELLWQRTVGGRVDTPPTIQGELALFGCRDGWVTCLRAADGELVWRFRAAPRERLVGARGQLESAWPVHGSVLVRDGVAYCVAGRSSFLDGGLYLYGLEPATGRVLHRRRLDGPWPAPQTGAAKETPNPGFTSAGALSDVLVADAGHVYLRHLRLDPTLGEMVDMEPNVYVSPKLSGENRGGDHKYWDNLLEAPRHALFTDPQWFHRSFFQNFPGRRLYATTGLLDDSWHRRMYWAYGQVVGQYIVFRGEMGYAVQAFATSPREGGLNAGDGYVVYAGRTAKEQRGQKLFALRPDQSEWRIRVPFRPVAMVLAGDRLLLAGPPDSPDPEEALAAVEGKRGGVLWVLSAPDGKKLAEHSLESPPVFDGMAVAERRVYITTRRGALLCLGGRRAADTGSRSEARAAQASCRRAVDSGPNRGVENQKATGVVR
ncbi:MAG: PQQ-binding-like beta-propeller repeat protein [bacterium]